MASIRLVSRRAYHQDEIDRRQLLLHRPAFGQPVDPGTQKNNPDDTQFIWGGSLVSMLIRVSRMCKGRTHAAPVGILRRLFRVNDGL
jgi:hypothetical protein